MRMRTLAAALLAVPVMVLVYLSAVLRRSVAARLGLALGVGALLVVAMIGAVVPSVSTARPPSTLAPVAAVRFGTDLRVNQPPYGPITLEFATPMDPASVVAALRIDPPTQVRLAWNAARTRLVVTPSSGWRPATYYTVTVDATAHDSAGATLETPARAAFTIRPATRARILADGTVGDRVLPETSFSLAFDRPIDVASVTAAFSIEPPVAGSFAPQAGAAPSVQLRFVPDTPLRAGTTYTLRIADSARDADGGQLAPVEALTVITAEAPAVVRFRPLRGARDVARQATVSVRFTTPMDRRSTAAAFAVTTGGRAVEGRISWVEDDTVLVFEPAAPFPAGATVTAAVRGSARSRDGVALERAARGSFTVVAPSPSPTPRPATTQSATATPKPAPSPTPAGGGVTGSGAWSAVETYYLRLMNCTRQGGWVTSSGACSSPGGRDVAPLVLDAGISNRVSRPYAKLLATGNLCSHFVGGTPGDRLSRAGYTSYDWAENIGCRSGDPFAAVLATHLFYQSEKAWNGDHYRILMNPLYTRVGIGVWVSAGRVRLVVDFYRP